MNGMIALPPAPKKHAAPTPSFVLALPAPADGGRGIPEVVPATSRMAGKVRSLVERHPEETLGVLRRWMEENIRG